VWLVTLNTWNLRINPFPLDLPALMTFPTVHPGNFVDVQLFHPQATNYLSKLNMKLDCGSDYTVVSNSDITHLHLPWFGLKSLTSVSGHTVKCLLYSISVWYPGVGEKLLFFFGHDLPNCSIGLLGLDFCRNKNIILDGLSGKQLFCQCKDSFMAVIFEYFVCVQIVLSNTSFLEYPMRSRTSIFNIALPSNKSFEGI